ncbi:MAG: hypothetical protein K6F56_04975 [Oscillospiraceae bacterium]|nr:hypothetical protein [Oscillospiraceae bacterium]
MRYLPYRKILALALCACMLLPLAACGGKTETVKVPAPTEAPAPEAQPAVQQPAAEEGSQQPAPVAAPSFDEQRALLESRRELWAFTDPWDSPWYYTFVDLDHNGRLEVIAATTQGSGMYTYGRYCEVTADFADVAVCWHANEEIEGPDDWPEIVVTSLPCYYDAASNSYFYPCEGITRSGYDHQYYAWYALSLKDGAAAWEHLASKSADWEDYGVGTISCTDASGAPISEEEYDSAPERRFAGMERSTLALEWTVEEIPFEESDSSWMDEPAPAEQTPPASTGTPRFKITKNPSSEAIAVGGRTWFIAHADNNVAPVWLLQSPDNQRYTLDDAMAANPGLQLEALPQDTLAVSNVPLSVNGWGVVARFDGDGGSLYTEPAYLYVGDFVTAYGSVIDKYRAAYQSGNNQNPWEYDVSEICAYSSGVGYALKDLDKNGVPELIIAGMGTEDFSDKMVYDLYTLVNGTPERLAVSGARSRRYIRTDNTVLWSGSSGAAYSSVTVQRVKGSTLEDVETIFTNPNWDNNDIDCYFQQGHSDLTPSNKSIQITKDDYFKRQAEYESTVYVPPLTKIA